MKTPKIRIITEKEQQIAAEILTAFMFTKDMNDVMRVWDEIFKSYELYRDPFTECPCSAQEYTKNKAEQQKQLMHELYGHCDGLED